MDFAMLFEKGRTLKVPEVIPFRLTPNIVAAFGIAGTEGPFQFAREIVLRVLRSSVEALMGIAEAFVHDPLSEFGKVSDAISRLVYTGATRTLLDAWVACGRA